MSGHIGTLMNTAKKTTIGYYLSYIALGLSAAMMGPTLPGLADQTNTQISQIGILFTARSIGFLFMTLWVGRLYDRVPGHRLLTLALFGLTLTMALMPTAPNLWVLTAVLFLMGMSHAGVDIGGNTLIVWLHGRAVGPYMNGMHFFFGVGSFLAPIIVAQVISVTEGMQWAFWILALLMLPAVFYVLNRPSPTMPETAQEAASGAVNWSVIFLIAIFFFIYSGIEIAYGGWIYSYAIATETGTVSTAAYLNSVFWGALTIGRLISIPIATRLRARVILFIDLVGCLASIALILLIPHSTITVWLGTIGLGLFMASIFPTTLTLAERNTTVSGSVTSYFFIGASLGAMSLPWLFGRQLDQNGPQAIMVLVFACLVLEFIVYSLLMHQIQREKIQAPSV
ncbi:MAG: hypothetical protein CSA11_04370 [Chloroflexi bacterium]|nr:MAG: hypothetical protein CSA11_04370 [Chloroflexota bacterium]